MNNRKNIFDCLVAWVNTFKLNENNNKCETYKDLNDGLLISKCLNHIDPEYFTTDWINICSLDLNDNCHLKLCNLKKILQSIDAYYLESFNYSVNEFEKPDLNTIVNSNNSCNEIEIEAELSHLLQLVLGCAVNCQRKSVFIKNIMELDEFTQHILMNAIQELMPNECNTFVSNSSKMSLTSAPAPSSISTITNSTSTVTKTAIEASANDQENDCGLQLRIALIELNRVNELKDNIAQKCKSLNKQVSELKDEKLELITEMEMLKERLQKEDNARIHQNNQLNMIMLDEYYKSESEKEKYQTEFGALKAEQEILLEKNVELTKIAKQAQILQDEVDILRHTSDKVEKLEFNIQAYRIKLEEMEDVKTQLKQTEEINSKYLEKIIQLEEEAKKIEVLKSTLEMHNKKQLRELHEKSLNDEMKMKKLKYEYNSIEKENMQLIADKQKLEIEIERSKSSITFKSTEDQENEIEVFSDLELINISTETKEKILRLSHENNKILQSKNYELEKMNARFTILESEFENERQHSIDLQMKLDETCQLKTYLEYMLNDFEKTAKLKDESIKRELANANERYLTYLEKAKIVIESLDSRNSQQRYELSLLNTQPAEKDK